MASRVDRVAATQPLVVRVWHAVAHKVTMRIEDAKDQVHIKARIVRKEAARQP